MKQALAAAVVAALGLAVGIRTGGGRPAAAPAGPIEQIDLMAIWSAYRENARAAEARYGGRVVEVTGPVLTVDKQDGETCLFLFDLDLMGSRPARARCLFAGPEYPELVRLVKTEKAVVRGRVSWEPRSLVGSSVVLANCTLVKGDDPGPASEESQSRTPIPCRPAGAGECRRETLLCDR
jgi:hypothetical protein